MGGITIATQNAVPAADMGTATAGSALAKQIGGTFGLACAQSLMGSHHAVAAAEIGSSVAWEGAIAGVLALAAVLMMRNLPIPTGKGVDRCPRRGPRPRCPAGPSHDRPGRALGQRPGAGSRWGSITVTPPLAADGSAVRASGTASRPMRR